MTVTDGKPTSNGTSNGTSSMSGGTRVAGGSAGASSAQFLSQTIENRTQLHGYCEKARQAFHTAHDMLEVTADDLGYSIENYGRAKGLGAGARKLLARRVTRNMRHAAKLQLEAAKAMQACWVQSIRAFDQIEEPTRRSGGRTFDPEK